jgi:hypothetical protein
VLGTIEELFALNRTVMLNAVDLRQRAGDDAGIAHAEIDVPSQPKTHAFRMPCWR